MIPPEIYVVRSKCGRDRKRLYLALGAADKPYPAVYIANGAHPIEHPKVKNIAHLAWIAPLSDSEKDVFLLSMTNKTVLEILANYEQNGEFAKKSAKGENPA